MTDDIAIKVENLSKCYHIYEQPRYRLLQMMFCGHKQFYREFWALKNVSFEIKKGETVGIIGRNGSGKSTLLQMICGTLNPTSGRIETRGRIGALLELGSGFNPQFTGRENVYMNAAVLGLSRCEVDARFDDIAAFAGIGEFIDQPINTYSSGMVVRLAFAVQSQVDPDILIVDEALSVGDAKFQAKCFERLRRLKENGTTILLVTHSSEQIVTHCSNAILLEDGEVCQQGDPRAVVNRYLDLLFGTKKEAADLLPLADSADKAGIPEIESALAGRIENRPNYNKHEYRWGSGAAQIVDCMIVSNKKSDVVKIEAGDSIDVYVKARFIRAIQNAIFGLTIKTPDGVTIFGANSRDWGERGQCRSFCDGEETVVRFSIGMNIAAGEYLLSLGIAEESKADGEIIPLDRRYDSIYMLVHGKPIHSGLARLPVNICFIEGGALA